ncbi:MAG: type II toxin-antitoxin system HicA family toxin [Sarcina sp.]|nr:type II toxin-antitoxin system HicA family toxin [Sarcina sp.]
MPSKEKLMRKLFQKRLPRNFTKQELAALLSQCGCLMGKGGRGSGIRFFHERTERILAFDEPHPGNELYPYQVKMVRQFLIEVGEYRED